MSALAEIGHGQNTSDTEWERIKDKYLQNPKISNSHIDLDPALKELKQIRVPSDINPEALEEAMEDAKQVRQQALSNAKKALETAFAPKLHEMFNKKIKEEMSKNVIPQKPTEPKPDEEFTEDDLDDVITELELENESELTGNNDYTNTSEKKKSLDETKKLIENFRDKLAKYPKYSISIDGSTKLCVLLSLNSPAQVSFKQLPKEDQNILRESVKNTPYSDISYFYVMLDEGRDFKFVFSNDKEEGIVVHMFNAITHPQLGKQHIGLFNDVPIRADGEKIAVGNIIIDKKHIKQRIGIDPSKKDVEQDDNNFSRRQSVAGRNAFELRNDLVQMSIDLLFHNNKNDKVLPEEVVETAKVLYTFVENKR